MAKRVNNVSMTAPHSIFKWQVVSKRFRLRTAEFGRPSVTNGPLIRVQPSRAHLVDIHIMPPGQSCYRDPWHQCPFHDLPSLSNGSAAFPLGLRRSRLRSFTECVHKSTEVVDTNKWGHKGHHHRLFTLGIDGRNQTFTLRVSNW
jgi:hypothetical protein